MALLRANFKVIILIELLANFVIIQHLGNAMEAINFLYIAI